MVGVYKDCVSAVMTPKDYFFDFDTMVFREELDFQIIKGMSVSEDGVDVCVFSPTQEPRGYAISHFNFLKDQGA